MDNFIEIELSKGRKKTYLNYDIVNDKLYVEINAFPPTMFYCAAFDNEPLIESVVGEKGKSKRMFVSVDWVINEWDGADKEMIEALKKRKEIESSKLNEYREKYLSQTI